MGKLHARLHRLPISGFPIPAGSFLSRSLRELDQIIESGGWQDLKPGLAWLMDHRPAPPVQASILHLDYHPLNLIDDGTGALVVIDWTEAGVGDPHADVANTRMLLACMRPAHPTPFQRLEMMAGRIFLRRRYLIGYRRIAPVDRERLVYYQAWAALRRLCQYGHWLQAMPQKAGCKSSAIEQLSPEHLHVLEAYFEKQTGVAVRL